MRALRVWTLALVVVVVAVVAGGGCKKDDGSDLPSEMKPRRASVDPGKLDLPKLLEHVPADTPFIVAGLEAVPLAYYAKMKKAFGGLIDAAFTAWRLTSSDDNKLLDAVLSEMDGKWNAEGIESLGLSSQPRFAVYGQSGVAPIVARIEVKDAKVVLATFERIARRVDKELPPMETRGGRSFWRIPGKPGKSEGVVALVDNQLVFAAGPPAAIERSLDLVLGIEKPKDNLGDAKQLTELMTRHGFGANLIGFVDTRRILLEAAKDEGRKTDACEDEIARIAKKIPRIAFGYGELTAERTSAGLVVELSPELVAKVEALRTEVPGLARALSDEPLIAMGGGLDIAKGQELMLSFADVMRDAGEACHAEEVVSRAKRMTRKLDKDLPEAARKITGFAGALTEIEFGGRRRRTPIPDSLDAFACVSSRDAKDLFEEILDEAREIRRLDIKTDGSMHAIDAKLPVEFDLYAGVGSTALCTAAGKTGKSMANHALGARPGKAPFFAASYDWGKYVDIYLDIIPERELHSDFDADSPRSHRERAMTMTALRTMSRVLGRTTMTVDISDKGLAAWAAIETK
ncbi:MAG: hypothetical protein KIT31_28620 [Deltaproteobacteria bacterium]|nr:hypothetical protein [Deltaproteobacteria bacterium]